MLEEVVLDGGSMEQGGLARLGSSLFVLGPLEKLSLSFSASKRTHDELREFVDHVSNMSRLKSLHISCSTLKDIRIADLIVELAKNRPTLESVNGLFFAPSVKTQERQLQYYLKLNRYGRRFMGSGAFPMGLWPKVLCKIMSDSEHDAAMFFLKNVPGILHKGLIRAPPPNKSHSVARKSMRLAKAKMER
jgi:hypothetical protein